VLGCNKYCCFQIEVFSETFFLSIGEKGVKKISKIEKREKLKYLLARR
jgi:hypothetical protein